VSTRTIALYILCALDDGRSKSGELLNQVRSDSIGLSRTISDYFKNVRMVENLDDRDRALCTELVYGTLRWRGYLDYLLERCITRPLSRVGRVERHALRLGAYQIAFLARIPSHAAVYEMVEIIKRIKGVRTGRFINAVLRKFDRIWESLSLPPAVMRPNRIAVEYSHPRWMIEILARQFSWAEILRICYVNNCRAPLTIRCNSLKSTRVHVGQLLRGEGAQVEEAPYAPQGLYLNPPKSSGLFDSTSFQNGYWCVQDEAAQLVSHLLEPQPGEHILDACAGRGGKTSHLAELTGDKAHIDAVDLNPRNLESLRNTVHRLGITSVHLHTGDIRDPSVLGGCSYDKILVDAPCSGLGVLRRYPEIKWRRTAVDILRLSRLQKEILEAATRRLRPGGLLVYAVCTITAQEGPDIIAALPELEIVVPAQYNPALPLMGAKGFLQTLPKVGGYDGFYAAVLRKRES